VTARGGEQRPLDVRRALDAGTIPPVWLWAGPEEFLKDELWSRVVAATVPSGLESMNVTRGRGGADDVHQVLAGCRTLPMMAARRAVFYRDVEKLAKHEEESLAGYVRKPSPETILVLASGDLPGDPRNRRLAEAGAVPVVFWTLFERDAVEWIRIRFRDLGKRCDTEVARELLHACGASPDQEKVALAEIAPEIEKVALALGSRDQVRSEDMAGIGRRIDQALRNELILALSFGREAPALRALDGLLLFKDWDEIRVLVNLTYRMVALAQARDLLDRGTPPGDIRSLSGVWGSSLDEVKDAARGWTAGGIRRSLDILARADRSLKSSGKPSRIVLETALLEIAAARPDSRIAGSLPSPRTAHFPDRGR
jgi:DNA polymerase-3 subunit delta